MRRSILITSTGLALLAVALLPAAASAEHHGRHHHRHHHRGAHTHLKRFGTDNPSAPVGDNTGTVASFAEGTLTIKLTDGSSVTGKVTSTTELKCEAAGSARMADHGSENNGDRDNGGNRHGGPGTSGPISQPGDDNGQDVKDEDDRRDEPNEPTCDTTVLTAGTIVRGAELRISSTGATFAEVEIVR